MMTVQSGSWRDFFGSDSVHRSLARRLTGTFLVRTSSVALRSEARHDVALLGSGEDPNWLYVYLYAVIAAWCVLALGFGLLMVVLAYVGERLAGSTGREMGVGVGAALSLFCVTGMAVAAWHSLFAYAARRRFRRSGQLDQFCKRNIRLSKLHNGSLVPQAAVGLLVGVLGATGNL